VKVLLSVQTFNRDVAEETAADMYQARTPRQLNVSVSPAELGVKFASPL